MHGRAKRVSRVAAQALFSTAFVMTASCVRPPCDGHAPGESRSRQECVPSRAPAAPVGSPPACPGDHATVLGACVTLSAADAYCQAGKPLRIHFARMSPEGCVFTDCPGGGHLDIVTGTCDSAPGLCGDGEVKALARGSAVCLGDDGACPRGTTAAYEAKDDAKNERPHLVCKRPPPCPLGSIRHGDGCRPIVMAGVSSADRPRVDLAAWSISVLGPSGGDGSADLCRPLAWTAAASMLRYPAFSPTVAPPRDPPARSEVRLRISVVVPDEDITRAHASVVGRTARDGESPRPAMVEAARASVDSLLEPLRALGGESTTAAIVSEVTCAVASVRPATRLPSMADAGADALSRASAQQ
jgi:hypothetical protein